MTEPHTWVKCEECGKVMEIPEKWHEGQPWYCGGCWCEWCKRPHPCEHDEPPDPDGTPQFGKEDRK